MRRLCRLEDIEDGGLLAIEPPDGSAADADPILLYRHRDAVRAWHNVCPHAGSRLDWAPGRFLRDGENLVCAHHGAAFELEKGLCVSGPCRGQSLAALEIVIRDGDVWIEAGAEPRSGL